MKASPIHPALAEQLSAAGVNIEKLLSFMEDLNSGKFSDAPATAVASVPGIDHPSIIDRRDRKTYRFPGVTARERFESLRLPFSCESVSRVEGAELEFTVEQLEKIGIYLYPKTAYGLLNGGSASSYADTKKNRTLDPAAFQRHEAFFKELSGLCAGRPKGVTPAYINPDGSPGYSFLLMKLRMILLHRQRYQRLTDKASDQLLPVFQMTSVHTDPAIQEALEQYRGSAELKDLSDSLGGTPVEVLTGIQTMLAAITHSSEGNPRRIFDRAYGNQHTGIAMPGGHGQNFEVLAPIYRQLYQQGIRYIWIGNIDNMGYTVDPVSLAIFALTGAEAAFEESFRTPIDVKGGILVQDQNGHLNCADIGPVISTEEMLAFEKQGKPVLFNCGIGLFDLEKLITRLNEIPWKLPLRVTDQDKDAGRYAQAEQITWEVIGLLDTPVFFAVNKSRRFIAAKMLLENLMTSLVDEKAADAASLVTRELHSGLEDLLRSEYGMILDGRKWKPSEAKK